jgi:hypothetical protein
LKACRKIGLPRGARNRDVPGFQRFAQNFQDAAVKFGEFVQDYIR